MQLYGDSEVTPVAYDDVVYLQQGMSMKAFWAVMGVGFAGVAAMAAVGIHEVNSNKLQIPAQPAQPVFPVW